MAHKSVLAIGLVLPPSPAVTAIQSAVASAISTAKASGYDAQPYAVDLADSDHVEKFQAFYTKRSWDAVMIGWGIRGNPEHTALFEKLVNTVVAESNPVPKFIFSLKPDALMEAITRVLGDST